jgi:hypothetical protein
MAHFAELDANNVVLRVVVIGNKDTADANGVEKEYIGAAFCERLFGGTWKQTSYNGSFRKNYAGIGYTYDVGRDAFLPLKPYQTWVLDEDKCIWISPVPKPEDASMENQYTWDDSTVSWVRA